MPATGIARVSLIEENNTLHTRLVRLSLFEPRVQNLTDATPTALFRKLNVYRFQLLVDRRTLIGKK